MADIVNLYGESNLTGSLQEPITSSSTTCKVLFFSKNDKNKKRIPQAEELRLVFDLGKKNQEEMLLKIISVNEETEIVTLEILKRNLKNYGSEQESEVEGVFYHTQNATVDSVAGHWVGNILEKILKGDIIISGNEWKLGDGTNSAKVLTGVFENEELGMLKFELVDGQIKPFIQSMGSWVSLEALASHGDIAKIKQHDDIDTAVSDNIQSGDIMIVDENLKYNRLAKGEDESILQVINGKPKWVGMWGRSSIFYGMQRQFSFFNNSQYLFSDRIYDKAKNISWRLEGIGTSKGGGFISEDTIIYQDNFNNIKKAVLNEDSTTTITTITSADFPEAGTKNIITRNNRVYVNNNAGEGSPNILSENSTLTATFNNTTKILRYDVTAGVTIDFTQKCNVGDSIDITGSLNSSNNTSRIVANRGVNFIEFNAPDIVRSITPTPSIVPTNGSGNYKTLSGSTTITNTQLGDRITLNATMQRIQPYSGYSYALLRATVKGVVVEKLGNLANLNEAISVSNVQTATGTNTAVSLYAFLDNSTFALYQSITIKRDFASAVSEGANTNLSFIVGGAENRIIRAFSVSGNNLVHESTDDIFLPFELFGYCVFFLITENEILMSKDINEYAVYNLEDKSFVKINRQVFVYIPLLVYVQDIKISKCLIQYDNSSYIFNFPKE